MNTVTDKALFSVRMYEPDDYPTLLGWWEKHGVPPVAEALLHPCGLISFDGNELVAAAWVYCAEGVALAWFAWLVTNPDVGPVRSERGMRSVLSCAEGICHGHGRRVIYAEAPRDSLLKWYQRNGFTAAHSTVQLYKLCPPSP